MPMSKYNAAFGGSKGSAAKAHAAMVSEGVPYLDQLLAAKKLLDAAPVPTTGRMLHDGVRLLRQEAARKGGQAKSLRKHKAAVGNGMKGGRPKKARA